MAHDPSYSLVPESHSRYLKAIAHVLLCPSFCYQTNLLSECTTISKVCIELYCMFVYACCVFAAFVSLN